jgi:DNA-binding CsgD family transcriptional regulator
MPYDRNAGDVILARGELEALCWSKDGLTDAEVGKQMGISGTEAMLRLRRAMTRLGCTSKYEAALRAIRLGLMKCD